MELLQAVFGDLIPEFLKGVIGSVVEHGSFLVLTNPIAELLKVLR
jgi:hypothetical protein